MNVTYIKYAIANIFKRSNVKNDLNKVSKTYRGSIAFNPNKCIDCKKCMEVCTPQSISNFIENTPGGKRVTYRFDAKTCVFCGLCSDYCPKNAISFQGESKLLNTGKNMLMAEGTLLIEDYKANKNEVLSVTQPISVIQIEELMTTIHGQIDIAYEENKKTEEKEARGELIKILFNEDEEKEAPEKPVEKEVFFDDDVIKTVNIEDIKVIPVKEETVKEEAKLPSLDLKPQNEAMVNNSQNKELLKELFSEDAKNKKTLKDSIFETTTNIKGLLKNILIKKDGTVEVRDLVSEKESEGVKESANEKKLDVERVNEKKLEAEDVHKNFDEQAATLMDEEIVQEDLKDKDEEIVKKDLRDKNEEIVKEDLRDKNKEIIKEDLKDKNDPHDIMNNTIITGRSRDLLKELFPEKNFKEDEPKNDPSVQVLYKKEDFSNTHKIIKRDLLPTLFPENYENVKKNNIPIDIDVNIPEYKVERAQQTKNTVKPIDKNSNNNNKKNKPKKKK